MRFPIVLSSSSRDCHNPTEKLSVLMKITGDEGWGHLRGWEETIVGEAPEDLAEGRLGGHPERGVSAKELE